MAPRVIYAILFSCLLVSAKAQQFPVIRLSVEEGLGHSIVYRTYQTRNGYIWFSTDNGLTRYDGVNFKNFTSENGLGSNFIFDVKEWKDKLYISALGGGLMVYENNTITPAFDSSFQTPPHPVELTIHESGFFVIDRFRNLYVNTGSRFFRITPEDFGLHEKSPLEFFQVYTDHERIYVACSDGLYMYANNVFSRIPLEIKGPPVVYRITSLPGKLILTTENELLAFNPEDSTITTLLVDEDFSRHTRLLSDSEGNLWVSTLEGSLYFLKNNPNDRFVSQKILDDVVLNDLFEDREKNIWLSTYGEGAWYFQSTHLRNYSIRGGIVSDMIAHKNMLFVSTINAGVKLFGQDQNRFLYEINGTKVQKFFSDKPYLIQFYSSGDDELLLSSSLTLYRWRNDYPDSVQVSYPISSLFFQKSKNRLILGSRFSLAYVDPTLKQISVDPGMTDLVIRAIEEDFSSKLLLGTDKGTLHEDKNGNFYPSKSDFPRTDINAFYKDTLRNQIWVATNSGLGILRHDTLKLVDDPLTRIRCNSVTGDESGQLWIGTVKGLLYYDGNTFELLTTKEGIAQSNILKVLYQQENKLLALLSPNYLSLIDTESITQIIKYEIPDILVGNISAEDKEYRLDDEVITLEPGRRQLNIQLSTPLIRNRDKIQYSYRINNKPWSDFNGQELSLHSLPYGKLNITIKAYKHNKEHESKTLVLSFFSPPPFYLKWWFILIVVAGLALLGAYIFSVYSRRKHNNLIEENKRLDIEHQALRNLLNPHFLYNAINSIHAFILQNDQRKTLGYLSKFSQLVRLNLDLLATDHASLDKEIKNISLYLEFEKLRFADKLNYEIEIDPGIHQSEIILPSFIIQPFVENAIWHGLLPREGGGNLKLKISRNNGRVIIVIEDDGIGINQSLLHPKNEIDKKTSMGINIIRERFELLKKVSNRYSLNILDKSELNGKATGTGTVITITVPTAG